RMILNHRVAALDVAGFAEPSTERSHPVRGGASRRGIDEANHRHRLLRARRERPRRRRAAEQRDELAALHSITSSARASSGDGMVRPSAFAVIKFTIRSNLVGCSTRMLLGFAPRRILST